MITFYFSHFRHKITECSVHIFLLQELQQCLILRGIVHKCHFARISFCGGSELLSRSLSRNTFWIILWCCLCKPLNGRRFICGSISSSDSVFKKKLSLSAAKSNHPQGKLVLPNHKRSIGTNVNQIVEKCYWPSLCSFAYSIRVANMIQRIYSTFGWIVVQVKNITDLFSFRTKEVRVNFSRKPKTLEFTSLRRFGRNSCGMNFLFFRTVPTIVNFCVSAHMKWRNCR